MSNTPKKFNRVIVMALETPTPEAAKLQEELKKIGEVLQLLQAANVMSLALARISQDPQAVAQEDRKKIEGQLAGLRSSVSDHAEYLYQTLGVDLRADAAKLLKELDGHMQDVRNSHGTAEVASKFAAKPSYDDSTPPGKLH